MIVAVIFDVEIVGNNYQNAMYKSKKGLSGGHCQYVWSCSEDKIFKGKYIRKI